MKKIKDGVKFWAAVRRKTNDYDAKLLEDLKDLDFAADFLTLAVDGTDDEEFEIFYSALSKIVKAQGIEDVAEKMESSRDTLYKMFKHQNTTHKTLAKLLDAIGLRMTFSAKRTTATRKRA